MSGPPEVPREERLTLWVDGTALSADPGDTVASALLLGGIRVLRRTASAEEPRGLYCAMGVCYECMVHAEGSGFVRACITPVTNGMRVRVGIVDGSDVLL